jgi:hypothetical protein
MKKNNQIFNQTIRKLKTYEPDEEVWQKIEANLLENALQIALEKLQIYEPSEEIWANIESEISHKKPTFIISKTWKRAAVAASIAIIFGVYKLYLLDNLPVGRHGQLVTNISYSTEKLDSRLLLNPNDDAEKQYSMIKEICERKTFVCETPKFSSLKTELEELSLASNELKNAIGNYNTDAKLVKQLTEIEQERASILRKMVSQI